MVLYVFNMFFTCYVCIRFFMCLICLYKCLFMLLSFFISPFFNILILFLQSLLMMIVEVVRNTRAIGGLLQRDCSSQEFCGELSNLEI